MIRRSIPAVAAAIAAGAIVASAALATSDDSSDTTPAPRAATTVVAPKALSGDAVATTLAGHEAVSFSEAKFPGSYVEFLATSRKLDLTKAWRLTIPNDDRPAWLLAGDDEIALVVPRSQVGPDGNKKEDGISTFGGTVDEVANRGLAASQSGGGQPSRKLVLVPPGKPEPRIVKRGTTESIREVPHAGALYVAQPGAGEQIYSPSLQSGSRLDDES